MKRKTIIKGLIEIENNVTKQSTIMVQFFMEVTWSLFCLFAKKEEKKLKISKLI